MQRKIIQNKTCVQNKRKHSEKENKTSVEQTNKKKDHGIISFNLFFPFIKKIKIQSILHTSKRSHPSNRYEISLQKNKTIFGSLVLIYVERLHKRKQME